MRSVISQTIKFPAAAEDLFEMYLDASKHEAITGSPVIIDREHDYKGVTEGWEKFYWTPWRDYLTHIPK